MTRKRYIKLLMSRGFSRNRAYETAAGVIPIFGSYQKAWDCFPVLDQIITAAVNASVAIANAFQNAFSGIGCTFAELAESMRKHSKQIQEAMKIESKDNCRHRVCTGHGHYRCQGRPGILPGAVRRRPPYRRTAPKA